MSQSVVPVVQDRRQRPSVRPDPSVLVIDAEDGPRLSDYKDILLDDKWLIAAIVAFALAIGVIYATLAAPVYRGNVLIQVEESAPDSKTFLNETSGLFEVKTPSAGELQVLGSRLVLGAAVDEAKLQINARPRYLPGVGLWLSSMATGLSDPGFMGLAGYVTGKESIDVARFEVPASFENSSPFMITAKADDKYEVRHKMLDAPIEGAVGKRLQHKVPGGSIDIELDHLEGKPGAEFLVSVVSRFRAIEQLQDRLQLMEQGRLSNVIAASMEDTEPARLARALNAIANQYVQKNMDRKSAEAEKTLAFLDAQLPVFQRQLQESENAYAKFRNTSGNIAFDDETRVWLSRISTLQASALELQQRRREADVNFTEESPRVMMLDKQIGAVQSEIRSLNARIASVPNNQRDALRLERDVKVNSALYQSMQNNVLQMRLVKEGKIGNVRLLDKAEVAEYPVKPQKALIVALALTLGLLAGVGTAIARSRSRSGIRKPDEAEASTGLEVFAVVPHSVQQAMLDNGSAKAGLARRLLADAFPHSEPAEALRSLRVTLKATLADAPNNRILVTGATPGVGKSFISSNFAALLSQSGKRVLLIDADLRRSGESFAFGLKSPTGLSDLLAEKCEVADAVHVDVRPNLDVITAGKLPDFPGDLLESAAFTEMLADFSNRYDFVIIDTAPILVAADAVTVARACGVVLMVTRAEHSQLGELNESVRRLNQAGVQIDGLVFNGMDLSRRYNSRYHYRHRSYRYKENEQAVLEA